MLLDYLITDDLQYDPSYDDVSIVVMKLNPLYALFCSEVLLNDTVDVHQRKYIKFFAAFVVTRLLLIYDYLY